MFFDVFFVVSFCCSCFILFFCVRFCLILINIICISHLILILLFFFKFSFGWDAKSVKGGQTENWVGLGCRIQSSQIIN